jgi:hypothetical protein
VYNFILQMWDFVSKEGKRKKGAERHDCCESLGVSWLHGSFVLSSRRSVGGEKDRRQDSEFGSGEPQLHQQSNHMLTTLATYTDNIWICAG